LLARVDVITSVPPLHDAVDTTSSSPLLPGSLLVVGLPPRSNVHVYACGGEPNSRGMLPAAHGYHIAVRYSVKRSAANG
jgi:hypothetical protein